MRTASGSAKSGFIWSLLSQLIKTGSQTLSLIILARLLPASDFGLIAMASVITGFTFLFRDFGTVAAVIRSPNLTPRLLNSVFWFNIAVGLGLAAILIMLSPLVAWFFSEPRLRNVIWCLALVFPLGAPSLVHQALLERASNFKPVALIESLAALLGLCSAVWFAWSGWGVYSLVIQMIILATVTTVGLWLFSPWQPRKICSLTEIKGIWGFSANLVGVNTLNYFVRNVDNILVGRFLGASDLGYYSMAYRLLLWPLQNISSVIGRALFPVFSRMQADRGKLGTAYLRITAAITLVSAPLMCGLFVLREPFIVTLLGSEWLTVADLLKWLAPVGLYQAIFTTVGILYLTTGETRIMFRWNFVASIVIVVAFVVGIQWGLIGLVVGYAVASAILFLPTIMIPIKLIELRVGTVLGNLLPSLLAAIAMAVIVALVNKSWSGFADYPFVRLSLLIALGVLSYGILSYYFQRKLLQDILRTLRER